MKIAVIGGGASGLMAAIYAAKGENEVVLFEKNQNFGKKLLMTGNGRCNYFNSDMDLKHYYSNDKDVLKDIITPLNINEILSCFEVLGVIPKIKNGYFYPRSNKSLSVLDALVMEAKLNGVIFKENFAVDEVKKEDKFIVKGSGFEDVFDKVILTLGSKAYPNTGSDGKGYDMAASFGHTVVKPLPALVPLVGSGDYFKLWSGARCEVTASLLEDGVFIKEETGEMQFTDYGISGICVFNLSSLVSVGLDNNKNEEVVINFVPFINASSLDDVLAFLEKRSEIVTGRSIFQLLLGFLEEKLVKTILMVANINPDKYYSELNKKEKYRLALNLYAFKIMIKETKSFDKAQVCSGGVRLNEVNPLTMESLLIKDLYMAGELLDVSGDCGGYNLAFAFISGMLAGKGTYYD